MVQFEMYDEGQAAHQVCPYLSQAIWSVPEC